MSCGNAVVSRETKMHFYMKTLSFLASTLFTIPGCGYRPAYADRPEVRYSVSAAPFSTPHPGAVAAALSGVRAALSKARALSPGAGYPRVVVELLRVDELPAGLASVQAGSALVPLGRGSAVGVVARAWVETSNGAAPTDETGDLRRVDYVAQGADAIPSAYAYENAVESAARRSGEALGARILGIAEPANDPM